MAFMENILCSTLSMGLLQPLFVTIGVLFVSIVSGKQVHNLNRLQSQFPCSLPLIRENPKMLSHSKKITLQVKYDSPKREDA